MLSLLRCFHAKQDRSWWDTPTQADSNRAAPPKLDVAAGQVVLPSATRHNLCTPTVEAAAKALQAEVIETDQNGHVHTSSMARITFEEEADRQAFDCSPQLLFNTNSVATHHSLTLKLQGLVAARPGSSGPAGDNWVGLGLEADARCTLDSVEQATACSGHQLQQQSRNRADTSITQSLSLTASATAAVKPFAARPDSLDKPQQHPDRQAPLGSHLPAPVRSELELQVKPTDAKEPYFMGSFAGNGRSSPPCWSNISSARATTLFGGGPGSFPQLGGGAPGTCGLTDICPTLLPVSTPSSTEELAALVSTLTQVRGHWLEALHTVVAFAAEQLCANSLSVYLLSDSGATHAPLACHGDAGGAIRLGMPLPAMAAAGQQPTALQRLYQTGESQRGSVWSQANGTFTAGYQHNVSQPQAHRALGSARLPLYEQAQRAPVHLQSVPLHQHLHDQCLQHQRQQQQEYEQQQRRQTDSYHQQQQHELHPDWQAMRVMGGMTDFAVVPLLRGDVVIGALQVVDKCTPLEDITGAMPTFRRCRSTSELAVVAAFIGTLLVDHEVLCLMGALEAVALAHDVDGLVRGLARHVGLFCCVRKHMTPGVRVALIRGDASALALFMDEGAAAAAAAAAGNLITGVTGASTTPAGVLSAAISRHSAASNLQHVSSVTPGGGGETRSSSHVFTSPAASATGMMMGVVRPSQPTIGGSTTVVSATGVQCVIPVYPPSMATCDTSSLLDTESLLPATVSLPAGPSTVGPGRASSVVVATGTTSTVEAVGIVHLQATSNKARLPTGAGSGGSDVLRDMAISSTGDLWPWLACTPGSGRAAAIDGTIPLRAKGWGSSIATEGDASTAATVEAALDRSPSLPHSAVVDDGTPSTFGREFDCMVEVAPAPRIGEEVAGNRGDVSNFRIIPVCGQSAGEGTSVSELKVAAMEPNLSHALPTAAAATGTLSRGLCRRHATESVVTCPEKSAMMMNAAEVNVPLASASVVGLSSMHNTNLMASNQVDPAAAQMRVTLGLYGRALALAGEDLVTTDGGRSICRVQGHAMLTRGTVLAEALAAGTGMYITDVAIYMQDGRNKSRDVFLAPSSRSGPTQPTNSIAVTTISHAGVPLVGIYLTYSTPLPASLLNALIIKVHAFGAMLGPLLHERLSAEDSELADEWRYLLGEVLDPQAIQAAADEQRSRRSSSAPYILQQQQQQPHAQTPPPLTALPSSFHNLIGIAPALSERLANPSEASVASLVGRVEPQIQGENASRQSGSFDDAWDVTAGRVPRPSARGKAAGTNGGASATAGEAPQLMRLWPTAATAEWNVLVASRCTSRVIPSVDGNETASCSRQSTDLRLLRSSVRMEAAAKAFAACTSDSGVGVAITAATATAETAELRCRNSTMLPLPPAFPTKPGAPFVPGIGRGNESWLPLAPSPMDMGSAVVVATTATPPGDQPSKALQITSGLHGLALGPKSAAATASGSMWPSVHTLLGSPPQRQRQQLASRRLPSSIGRGAIAAKHQPGCSLASSSLHSEAVLAAALPTGSPANNLGKAASVDITSGMGLQQRFPRRGHLGSPNCNRSLTPWPHRQPHPGHGSQPQSNAGRNLDAGLSPGVEYHAGQNGSNNIWSGSGCMSGSTSGTLEGATLPSLTLQSEVGSSWDGIAADKRVAADRRVAAEPAASNPSGSLQLTVVMKGPDEGSGAHGCNKGGARVKTAITMEVAAGRAAAGAALEAGSAAAVTAAPTALGTAVAVGLGMGQGAIVHSGLLHSKDCLLPEDRSDLKSWVTAPSVHQATFGSGIETSELQPCEDSRDAWEQLQHQQQRRQHLQPPSRSPFAIHGHIPLSPPTPRQEQQQREVALEVGRPSVDLGDKVPLHAPLHSAATLPIAAAVGAHLLHRSPSGCASEATAQKAISTPQFEMPGRVRALPVFLMDVNSASRGPGCGTCYSTLAGPLGSKLADNDSTSASSSIHVTDLGSTTQASRVPLSPEWAPSCARDMRPSHRGTPYGRPGSVLAGAPMLLNDASAVNLPRLMQPRLDPPAHSPLSPGRQYPNGGAVDTPATAVSRGSVTAAGATAAAVGVIQGGLPPVWEATPRGQGGSTFAGSPVVAAGVPGVAVAAQSTAMWPPMVQRLQKGVRRNTSFNIMANPGVQDMGMVAPLLANLQDKLRSLQAEQVLARLHSKDANGADELSGLTILEPLGSGGFGTVFRGIFNGIEAAVKVLCERGSSGRSETATMREAFELAVMTTISHPHIVQVLSAFTEVILFTQPNSAGGPRSSTTVVLPRSPATEELGQPTMVIVMEYCDAGSLADAVTAGRFRQRVLGGHGALQPCMPAIYATLLEIALALRHIHAMLLVHCDLKPANILLKSNMRDPRGFSAKLSDFGLVKMVVEDGTGGGRGVIGRDARTGTVTHMAPELILATESTKMDASVDIYAYGVLMWEMLSASPVYLGLRSEVIRRGVKSGTLRPEFPPWSDIKYRTLAEACLSTDPRARPTSAELVARLRTLLGESGALQDTIMRRPSNTHRAAHHGANNFLGGQDPGGFEGYPGAYTAAAAGAMLGIGPGSFCQSSRLLPPQIPQMHLAGAGTHFRNGRSRSCSGGNDSSTFPLHIL